MLNSFISICKKHYKRLVGKLVIKLKKDIILSLGCMARPLLFPILERKQYQKKYNWYFKNFASRKKIH